jgi:hypothetical protein
MTNYLINWRLIRINASSGRVLGGLLSEKKCRIRFEGILGTPQYKRKKSQFFVQFKTFGLDLS